MSQSLVSVLVPCYNAQDFIGDTLTSLIRQSHQDLEIIVIDDGSSDQSCEIVQSFEDERVKLIRQANAGACQARNRALSVARGKYIQFLDADDIIDRDKIAIQLSRLQTRIGYVASAEWGRFYISPKETTFEREECWADLGPVEWLVRSRHNGLGMLFPAIWLIPSEVVRAAGPWDPTLSLNDDGEYFTRVILASKGVLFCEGARCHYRSGVFGSLSKSKNWESALRVIELCEQHLRTHEDSDRVRRAFALSFQHFGHRAYPYNPTIAEQALRRAAELHSVKVFPDGGSAFRLIRGLIGWRAARRLQVCSGRP